MDNRKLIEYVSKLISKMNLADCIGILVYGSYVGGRSNELSDLDVLVIKDNYETQDCGSVVIDGIRVEYFVQDLKMMYKLIKEEINNRDPSHLTKFVTCKILYDLDGRVLEFINYAKELYNTKIDFSLDDNDRFSIFSINNRIEDLKILIDSDSFYSVYYVVLEKIRTLYAKINGIIDLPIMKIEKIYKDKDYADKYINSSVHNLPSDEFIDLYLKSLVVGDKRKMFDNLLQLYNYSFGGLDFEPKNFCLKFKKKAPFRI